MQEYTMYHNISSLIPSKISFLDGYVFGGGAGVSLFGKYVIVTEKTVFAMPGRNHLETINIYIQSRIFF